MTRLPGPLARGAFACALAGALLLALAASSHAATTTLGQEGGLKYVRAQTTVAATGATRAGAYTEVRCGRRPWKTTGGGAALSGDAGASFLSQIQTGSRATTGAAWHALQPQRKLSVYGICSKSKAVSWAGQLQTFPPAPSTLGASITCAEVHVLGGGVFANHEDSYINTTMPMDAGDPDSSPDDGWRAFDALLAGTSAPMIVYDICRTGPPPVYRSASRQLDPGEALTLRARCNAGHVTGGGAYVSGLADDAHMAVSRPIDGGDRGRVPDDGWEATVSNDSAAPETATVHAICIG
jgi:hypothetical protein